MIESVSTVASPLANPAATSLANGSAARPEAVKDLPAAKEVEVAPISPRLRPDFLSGAIVTEFVGNNGQVTQQLPTVAALAYMRAGLDANGQQKVDPNTPAQTQVVDAVKKA